MSQGTLSRFRDRMRATKDATRGPFRLLERRHGLAEIVKGGAVVVVKILRIIHLHRERDIIISSDNAPRHGYRLAQERLGFSEAP